MSRSFSRPPTDSTPRRSTMLDKQNRARPTHVSTLQIHQKVIQFVWLVFSPSFECADLPKSQQNSQVNRSWASGVRTQLLQSFQPGNTALLYHLKKTTHTVTLLPKISRSTQVVFQQEQICARSPMRTFPTDSPYRRCCLDTTLRALCA